MTVHDQLRASLDAYPSPDLDRLAGTARRRGVQRRRVRRATAGLIGIAAAVALAGGGLALTGRGSGTTVASDSSAAAVGPQGPAVQATPRGIAAALEWAVAQHSDGTASDFGGQGGPDFYSELHWDDADGGGASLVGINVQFHPGMVGGCDDPTYQACTQTPLADGSLLTTYTETDTVAEGTTLTRVADLIGPSGRRVVVTSTNGFDLGGHHWRLTRAEPPLSVAQLTQIAEQPFWGHTLPQSFETAGAELPTYVDLDSLSTATRSTPSSQAGGTAAPGASTCGRCAR